MRDVRRIRRKKEQEQESLERAARLNPKQQQADAALARKLAAKEEKELKKIVDAVEKQTEGIVFRVTVDIATGLLEDGTPAHEDDLARFEPWKKKLEAAAGMMKLKKFHWIVNYELEKKFEAARDTLRTVIPGQEPEEIQKFHGTKEQNIDSILTGGFRIGGVDGHPFSHGAGLGRGIYLADNAATSLGYCMGATRMFACRVLPGRTTADMQYSNTLPQRAVGSGSYESYSADASRSVIVVRHTDLVLPCYMIEWEAPAAPNYAAGWAGMALPAWAAAMPGLFAAPAPIPPMPLPVPVARAPRKRRATRARA
ncbi:hypothetical protein C8F01DRAFT_344691 [Mycena amicta]|nr:hypothetical protein C8F01DRAFT_344691 [Mycena amicta]